VTDADGDADARDGEPAADTGPRGRPIEADATAGPRAATPPAAGVPARVRVTAPRPAATRGLIGMPESTYVTGGASATSAGAAAGEHDATDATHATHATDVAGVYVRSLIRSQLHLALVCAGGFVVATTLFVFGIVWAPTLDDTFLAGVPVSWLLLAVGVYPLALTIAALYVRAATRNESRYRSLADDT
jgi:hypothetical protein